jgi:hypothetical protein
MFPDPCDVREAVCNYRNYYIMKKGAFAKWPEGEVPEWSTQGLSGRNDGIY